MNDERLTADFFLSEFLASQQAARMGIANIPGAMELGCIRNFLAPGMQEVRDLIGAPILISSGFRSPQLNRLVGGAQNSQHMQGLAADFIAPFFGTPVQIARALVASKVKFDQVIMEGSWVHVSFSPKPRRSILTAVFGGQNGTTYKAGIV